MLIQWKVRRISDGWEGEVTLPGKIAMKAPGKTKAEAVARAAGLAQKIASDPIIASLLPPQAKIGLKALSLISVAAKTGQVKALASKFKSPKLKKLALSLF